MARAFDVSELIAQADRFRQARNDGHRQLVDDFDRWTARTADRMRREIPKDTEETADSVTVDKVNDLTARIGPTNVDDRGRPVGFFINYGTSDTAPDDFIGRTAAVAPDLVDIDVTAVL